MGYQFSFADNCVYTAADVNAITSRLVTEGVAEVFCDGVASSVSQFNELGAQLYTDGVVGETSEALRVSITPEGKVLIFPGMAFFKDGAVFRVTDGGHLLDMVEGQHQYVYLQNDLEVSNSCYPVCSAEAPQGDTVLLAEVTQNGTVEDKRTFARGKLPGYSAPNVSGLNIRGNAWMVHGETKVLTFHLGNNPITHVLSANYEGGQPVCDLWRTDGTCIRNGQVYADGSEIYIYDGTASLAHARLSFADGVLTVAITFTDHAATSGEKAKNVPYNLYVF